MFYTGTWYLCTVSGTWYLLWHKILLAVRSIRAVAVQEWATRNCWKQIDKNGRTDHRCVNVSLAWRTNLTPVPARYQVVAIVCAISRWLRHWRCPIIKSHSWSTSTR